MVCSSTAEESLRRVLANAKRFLLCGDTTISLHCTQESHQIKGLANTTICFVPIRQKHVLQQRPVYILTLQQQCAYTNKESHQIGAFTLGHLFLGLCGDTNQCANYNNK